MLRILARAPEPGTIFHLSNPAPTRLDAIHAAAFDVLEMHRLRLTTAMPENLCAEERLVRRGLDIYRTYLTREEARFDQTALRTAISYDPAA